MQDGTVEQSSNDGAKLSVLKFQRYVFDLDQFANPQGEEIRKIHERYLGELFWPKLPAGASEKIRDLLLAEGHNRLAEPLYCLAFALMAMVVFTRGRRARGAYALRLTLACLAAGGLRILGYGVQGIGAREPAMDALIYLVPLGGALLTLSLIAGWWEHLFPARAFAQPEPAA